MAACRFSERALALAVVFVCCSVALADRSLLSTCSDSYERNVDMDGWERIDWDRVKQNFGDCYRNICWEGFTPFEKSIYFRRGKIPEICKNEKGVTVFSESLEAVRAKIETSVVATGEEGSDAFIAQAASCNCVALCRRKKSKYLVNILCSPSCDPVKG